MARLCKGFRESAAAGPAMPFRKLFDVRPRPIIVGAALLVAGCSGAPGRIRPPDVDSDAAAEAALEQLDKNGDGQLDDSELKSSPGLAAAKASYDGDSNGTLG